MGEEESCQLFQDLNLMKEKKSNEAWCNNLEIREGGDDEVCEDLVSIESSFEDSENSISSSISSSDLAEDASSATSSSTSSSNGPLYELSVIMAQLPIKRGLSKHYQGKSQSFTSLASVRSIEDLPKKVIPYKAKMKSCKSYGWGLAEAHNNSNNKSSSYSPKATISKKGSRGCFISSLSKRSISTLVITE